MAVPTYARRIARNPVRILPVSFMIVIGIGTCLLALPAAHADGQFRPLPSAFTAVSAVCITGLTVVDTATYWTPFGQGIILALAQLGGFGIMSLATLLSLLVRGRLELSSTLVVKAETQAANLGEAVALLRRIAVAMLVAESITAVFLTVRFRIGYDADWGTALWHGVFHAISSFTNAGFALYSTSIMGFVSDAWLIWPMCVAVLAGSIGYPALFELLRRARAPHLWSVHLRLTMGGFAFLFAIGLVCFLAFEWTNPLTLGPMSVGEKLNAGLSGTVMPRSAGFNIVDYARIRPETLVVTTVLMFIGGGAAGTSGGLKVTTFFLLGYVMLAEVRGQRDVTIAHRRIGYDTQRIAVSMALFSVGLVTFGIILLVILTDLPLDVVMFDVVSAFGTVGLSTGITGDLPAAGQILLMILMFLGRVGTVTAVSALALRTKDLHYRLPEERPILG